MGEQEKKLKENLANMADNFSDNLQKINKESKNWKKELTDGILPVLDSTAQAWIDVTTGPDGFRAEIKKLAADGTLAEWARTAVNAVTYVMDVFSGLKAVAKSVGSYIGSYVASIVEGFSSVGDVISKLLKGDFDGATQAFAGAMERQKAINEGLREDLDKTWSSETLGSKIRARIDELQKAGVASNEVKNALDLKSDDTKVESSKKIASAYESITKAIREKLAETDLELIAEKSLTEAQKLRVKFMDLVEQAHGKIGKAQVDEQNRMITAIRSNELARSTYEKNAKALENFHVALTAKDVVENIQKQGQAYASMSTAANEYNQSLQDNAELIQLEGSLMGESSAIRAATIEQFKVELDLRKQIRRIRETNMSEGERNDLERQAKENAQIAKSQAAIKAQQDDWSKFYSDIYNGLSDSLYRGFEAGKGFFQNFWDGIKNLFKTTVLKLAVQAVMGGVLGGVAGTASAGTAGGAFNAISAGKSLFDGFNLAASSAGAANVFSQFALSGVGQTLGLSSTTTASALLAEEAALTGGTIGASATSGAALTGAGSAGVSVASAMPYVAAALAAFQGFKSINGGFRIGGLSADAGALLGVAPRLFGMQDKQLAGQTITGSLGTDDISRNVAWTQKGGLFRSDRSGVWSYGLKDSTAIQDGKAYQDTANVANDAAMLKGLNDAYASLKASTTDFAKTLGLNADEIAARNDKIQFTLGSTAEETKNNLAKAIGEISNAMADSLLGSLASLKGAGEESSVTLARLADVVRAADSAVSIFGVTGEEAFGSLSEASIKARDAFVKLNGGVDALKAATEYFAQNFLTDTERLAPVVEDLHKRMAELGYSSVTTIEGFKNLVKGLDLTNASQAGLYAELLKLAPAFKAVADAAKTSVDGVAEAKLVLNGAQSTYQAALRAVADSLLQLGQKATAAMQAEANVRDKISQAYFTSQDAFAAAQQRIIEIARASAESMNRFSTSLKSFVAGLGGEIEGKSYENLKASLQTTATLAQGGDIKSQGDLTAIAQQFLNAAKARSTDASSYARDEASVKALLTSVSDAIDRQVLDLNVPAQGSEMEIAQKELVAAQKSMLDLAKLAADTGASSDRSLVSIAGSSSALLEEFKRAQADNIKAQADLLTAKALTSSVSLPDSSSLSGFFVLVSQLATAKESLDKAQANLSVEIIAAAKKAEATVGDFATQLGLTGESATLLAKAMKDANLSTDGFKALMSITGLSAKDLALELTSSGASAADMAIILARAGTDGEKLADRLRLAGISAEQFAAMLRENGLKADTLAIIFDTSKTAASALALSLGVPGEAAHTLATALLSSSQSSLDYKAAMEKAGTSVADLNVILKNSALSAGDLFSLLSITGGSANVLGKTLQSAGLAATDLAGAFGVAKVDADALTQLLTIATKSISAEDLAKSIETSQRSAQDFVAILGAAKLSASNLSEIVNVTGLSAAAILSVLGTSDAGLQGIAIASGVSLKSFTAAAASAGMGLQDFSKLLSTSGLTLDMFDGLRKLANASSAELAGYLNIATMTGADLSRGFTDLNSAITLAADAANRVKDILKAFKLPDFGDNVSFNSATKSLAQQVVESWYKTNANAIKTPDLEGVAYWVQEIEKNGLMAAKNAFANSVAITTNTAPIPINQFADTITPVFAPAPSQTQATGDALISELKALREEVTALREEQTAGDLANVAATQKTTKLLESVANGERSFATVAEAP